MRNEKRRRTLYITLSLLVMIVIIEHTFTSNLIDNNAEAFTEIIWVQLLLMLISIKQTSATGQDGNLVLQNSRDIQNNKYIANQRGR